MATVNIDTSGFEKDLKAIADALRDSDNLLRPLCIELTGIMHDRIHTDGQASDGSQIGTYSAGYMKLRTGNFKNSKKFVRGKNKGGLKDSGTVTKRRIATPFGKSSFAVQNIESEGIPRIKYNLDNDTKVILVLTRKLQNSWGPKAAESGTSKTSRGYAIGFVDSGAVDGVTSVKKIQFAEETYKKKISDFTEFENTYIVERLGELTQEIINGRS